MTVRSMRSIETRRGRTSQANNNENANVPTGSPVSKKRRLEPASGTIETELSNDMLHYILGFFLSSTGSVDGDTLRSAMLVSRRWKNVATSPSLWGLIHESSSGLDPVTNALRIRDISRRDAVTVAQAAGGEIRLPFDEDYPLSFIGFTKMVRAVKNGFQDWATVYKAMERSTGRLCRIFVSEKNDRLNVVVGHIFEAHFFQGEDAFAVSNDNIHMKNEYPRGVVLVGNQIVRWYEDGPLRGSLPKPIFGLHPPRDPNGEQMKAIIARLPKEGVASSYGYLRLMEESQRTEVPFTDHLGRRSWALIVDWLVEVAHCFNLPYRTVFHAMDILRRFFWLVQGQVTRDKYQLTASACMLIAVKCNGAKMKAVDFVYCSDNLFTKGHLEKLEAFVLEALQWKLARPTIMDFVESFMSGAPELVQCGLQRMLLRYVAKLALQSQIHQDFSASFTAACVLVLARYCYPSEVPLWKEGVYDEMTGYTFEQVCEGVVKLCFRLEEIRLRVPDVNVIERKFLSLVAGHHDGIVPTITSSSMLIAHQRRVASNDAAPSTVDAKL